MAIKLAFSTVACPEWTLDHVAKRAAEMGYEGVELRTLGAGSSHFACDPALTDAKKVHDVFRAHGVEPVCLSTSIEMHHRDSRLSRRAVSQTQHDLELASRIGCPYIRVFGHEVAPGEDRRSVIQRIAGHVLEVADRAGELGVQILFENAGSFNCAKEWWWLFDVAGHPMVGLLWNVANAAAAGEGPQVSVPCLNSRIRMAKVKDTNVGEGSGFVPLGEGTVQIGHFVQRLMGIGFDGYICVEWDRAWLGSLSPADDYLPDAHQRLHGWLDASAQAMEKAQAKAAKSAAKTAPRPRPRRPAAAEPSEVAESS